MAPSPQPTPINYTFPQRSFFIAQTGTHAPQHGLGERRYGRWEERLLHEPRRQPFASRSRC